MTFTPISPLWDEMPLTRTAEESAAAGGGASFTDIFRDAVENVKETDQEAVELEYLLSTGQLDNPAEVGIALYKASTAVNLLVNLRNEAVDAYKQLTNMSI